MITTTKEKLTEAMRMYNVDCLTNPDDYGEVDVSEDCAEAQIDNLLMYLKQVK